MNPIKKAGLLAVITALMSAACGCGGNGVNTVVNYEEQKEASCLLTFFGNKYEPENVVVIEEIISDFMKENPDIRVSYESLKGTDYFDALKKRMAAGKGDDVFMTNHDLSLELEAKGQLADLSGLSTIENYTDQMLGQMRTGDHIYWAPTTVSVFGLYCNLDLLKEHGQKVPENLGEWESVCEYFKGLGITPIVANNDISLKTLAIGSGFYSLYQENRQNEVFGRLNRGEEKLGDYLASGFSMVSGLIEKGYIDAKKALTTQKTSDDLLEFEEGESPFMLTGAWAAGRVESMEPAFKFEVVPYPILEDGSLVVINADTRLSVNADSEYPEAAYRFVEYFTQEDQIQKFADQQASLSPLKNGRPSSVKEIQPLIPCYRSGRTVIGTDSHLDLPIWSLTAQVSELLLSGGSVDAAMEWLDSQGTEGGEAE